MAATTQVRLLVWTFRNTQASSLKPTQVTQKMSTSNLGCRGHNATSTLDDVDGTARAHNPHYLRWTRDRQTH